MLNTRFISHSCRIHYSSSAISDRETGLSINMPNQTAMAPDVDVADHYYVLRKPETCRSATVPRPETLPLLRLCKRGIVTILAGFSAVCYAVVAPMR